MVKIAVPKFYHAQNGKIPNHQPGLAPGLHNDTNCTIPKMVQSPKIVKSYDPRLRNDPPTQYNSQLSTAPNCLKHTIIVFVVLYS